MAGPASNAGIGCCLVLDRADSYNATIHPDNPSERPAMARFEPGFDDFDEPPPGFDERGPTDPNSPPWPPPVSGKALASLIFGVMFCLPLLPSVLATLFGMMGLRETRDGSRSGRRFAVAGVILGGLGVAAWLLMGSRVYLFVSLITVESNRATVVAEAFLHELADGKVDAALARTAPATPREPLAAAAHAMEDWGRFDSVSTPLLPVFAGTAIRRWELEGTATFARADREVYIRLVSDGTTYRVEQFQVAGKWGVGGGRWGDPK